MRFWFLVASLAFFSAGCGCERVPGRTSSGEGIQGEIPCAATSDCPAPLVCDKGVCRPPSCTSDADCLDARFVCDPVLGECVRGEGRCLGDADCAADQHCDPGSNTCHELRPCRDGARRPCGTSHVGECQYGYQTCSGGVYGPCQGAVRPQPELCDGRDNDCDGQADESYDLLGDLANCGACGKACELPHGVATCSAGQCGLDTCDEGWLDLDGDPSNGCEYSCPPTRRGPEICDGLDNDCDGKTDEDLGTLSCGNGACARTVPACVGGSIQACAPGTPQSERCNGLDDDCDGATDEGLGTLTCGTGACRNTVAACQGGKLQACAPLPAATSEQCNGLDDDCDGRIDEGLGNLSCGAGSCLREVALCVGGEVQSCLPGPSAPEECNGLDDDCDGEIDDGLASLFCGVGACARSVDACLGGAPQVCEPGAPAPETCDGVDNDCNGATDEVVTVFTQDGGSQSLEPVYRPVDIILVVANNGTMSEEIEAVEANINVNFARILEASRLDYRVIVLSKYGAMEGAYPLCVSPPLSGNTSCWETCPVNGSRFFQYSVAVGTHDSLSLILSTYNAPDSCGLAPGGWSQWLRPGASRVFIEITDNGPTSGNPDQANNLTADLFEARLFSLTPAAFGTPQARDYVFHSIVGLLENEPAWSPWLPEDPLVDARCTGNGGKVQQPGLEYQKLSLRTAGLRYPICQYQSFDAVFRDAARGILERSQIVCDFRVPSIPAGSSMDFTRVDLLDSAGGRVALTHVAGESACSGDAFYVEGDAVHLCPDACALWRDDPSARVEVQFTCFSQVR